MKKRIISRRLGMEALDDRRMLATFTVDTLLDESDGNFSAGDFSLREAIAEANATPATNDTIQFAPNLSGTIRLLAGELKITSSLTMHGTDDLRIAIDGNDESRIFNVAASGAKKSVRIDGLELIGGKANGGGAIRNDGEHVTLQRLYTHDNSSTGAGGAVFATNGAVMNIMNSTLAENHADGQGGGIFVQYATLNVTNTTLSGNLAQLTGGGIGVGKNSRVKVINATIVNNSSGEDNGERAGGGISAYFGTGSVVTLHNSIVYNNRRIVTINDIYMNDVAGTFQPISQNNIIGYDSGSNNNFEGLINGVNGNQIELSPRAFAGRVLDTELRLNNGVLPSHALIDQSLAVDAGNNDFAVDHWGNPLQKDQNGHKRILNSRPRIQILNTIGFPLPTVDVGAVETQNPELDTTQHQTYRRGDPPILISPSVNLLEKNRGTFGGGSITITIDSGGYIGTGRDSLGFLDDDDFTIIGGEIRFLGKLVASYSGGWGRNPLGISFVQDATVEEAEQVLRHLTFRSSSTNLPSQVFFAVDLRDGGGGYGFTFLRLNVTSST